MMKRQILWMMAAILICGTTTVTLSSCSEDNNATPTGGIEIEPTTEEVEPTTDQMAVSVTASVPAAVLSKFNDNSTGAAFVKRLPETSGEITDQTRLVVVKGSDALTIPVATVEAMADVYLNGGYIAIETPTGLNMTEFGAKFAVALLKKQNARLSSRFLVNGLPINLSAEESQAVERLKTRIANIVNVARETSGGIIDKLKSPIAEMLILSGGQYFMEVPFVEEGDMHTYAIDDEDNRTDDTFTLKTERNGFHNGEMADAAAEWLNEVAKPRVAQARKRAATRANAQDAINELMDPSETFTFVGNAGFRNWKNESKRRTKRVKQTIRSWGVHDMDNNKDYYYVKQNVTLSMGNVNGEKFFYPKEGENWWSSASNYGDSWHLWYGAFLSKYDTSMELTGKGTIALEAAMPETKNSSTTQSISIGTSHSKTTTVGITWGASGGPSYAQKPGYGGSGALNISGSFSKGYTDSRSFNMGYSRAIEDLTVSKNTNGKKVSWTYEGNKPKGYVAHDIYGSDYTYCHQTAPEILVSDADLLNEICWSVDNPEGAYTVNIYSLIETAALMESSNSSKNNIKTKYEYTPWDCDGDNNFSHQLLEPFRARQTWRMNIIIDEWENGIVTGAQSEIDNYLKDSYPALYAHEFTICDKTSTSVEVISSFIDYSKSIFDYNYDILQGLAHSYGVKQFTIHWRCDDTNVTVKEGYTVKVDDGAQEQDQTVANFRLDYDTDNTDLIAHYAGKKANVTLGGRRFIKNGSWNSLTLPFDLDDFAGTPLEGASVRELKSVECSDNTITLKFSAVASIKAHRPYIVRWDEGDDVLSPMFSGVTIQDGSPVKVTMSNGNEEVIAFVGVYDPLTLKANDHSKLFFGNDSKLYWPSEDVPVYADFAYFQLYNSTYTNVVIR